MSATRTTGMRTIWITLRAVNYTTMVFADAIKSIKTLKGTEEELAISSLRAGQHALSAGLMWATLGQMMDNTLSKNIMQIGIFKDLADALKPYVAGLFTLFGVIQMVHGVMHLFSSESTKMIKAILMKKFSVDKLTISYWKLGLAVSAAFIVFITLQKTLGTVPAMLLSIATAVGILAVTLWKAAVPMAILTWGLAAIAAGFAIAGAVAAAGGIREFQMGTRMVQATGPAIVHRGEVIYNPVTNRPTQVGNDLIGNNQPVMINYEMPITIKEVHTKADFDDVDERFRESLRKTTRNQKR